MILEDKMAGFWARTKDFLLGMEQEEDEYDGEDYIDEDEEEMEYVSRPQESKRVSSFDRPRGSAAASSGFTVHQGSAQSTRPRSNIVDINSRKTQVDFCYPKSIETARPIMESTQQGVISVVDLTGVDSKNAQRIVDFIGGSTYALEGNLTRINDDIILVSPYGVDVRTAEIMNKIKENTDAKVFASSRFPW